MQRLLLLLALVVGACSRPVINHDAEIQKLKVEIQLMDPSDPNRPGKVRQVELLSGKDGAAPVNHDPEIQKLKAELQLMDPSDPNRPGKARQLEQLQREAAP